MNAEINTPSHKIIFFDNGIVKDIPFTENETLEKAKEALNTIKVKAGDKKFPLLVDIREQKSITREARQYYSSSEFTNFVIALAFIIESPISKVLANFYLGLNKPPYPTHLFTNETKAMNWLKEFLP